jgi:hypothetical protein
MKKCVTLEISYVQPGNLNTSHIDGSHLDVQISKEIELLKDDKVVKNILKSLKKTEVTSTGNYSMTGCCCHLLQWNICVDQNQNLRTEKTNTIIWRIIAFPPPPKTVG